MLKKDEKWNWRKWDQCWKRENETFQNNKESGGRRITGKLGKRKLCPCTHTHFCVYYCFTLSEYENMLNEKKDCLYSLNLICLTCIAMGYANVPTYSFHRNAKSLVRADIDAWLLKDKAILKQDRRGGGTLKDNSSVISH